ncbi:MAG: hypothetical protein DRJ42_27640 [Deltaproteobacteria bacterium]|nr:MAG: hypothetical protein DRJ42_27640 [Deltaproteobacteria bacterium]
MFNTGELEERPPIETSSHASWPATVDQECDRRRTPVRYHRHVKFVWALSVVVAVSSVGCTLDRSATLPPPDGGPDTAVPDTTVPDSGAADSTSPPDATTPPEDAAPDVPEPVDAAVPPDCATHAISACATSHSDVDDCTVLFDGLEVAPECPTQSRVSLDCRSSSASYCDDSASCLDPSGCVRDVWFRFDLGAASPVDQIRFLAGWWSDRPDAFEVWSSDSDTAVPDAGATLVYSGTAHAHPWRCVAGEPCTDEVPGGCCPDGRGALQVTDQTAYSPSCDLGLFFPKFDAASFPQTVARHWYLMVRNAASRDRVWLNEVEFRLTTACR